MTLWAISNNHNLTREVEEATTSEEDILHKALTSQLEEACRAEVSKDKECTTRWDQIHKREISTTRETCLQCIKTLTRFVLHRTPILIWEVICQTTTTEILQYKEEEQ